jgi:four helix bundle protein
VSKSPVRDFRDLVAWQEAIELALECDAVCDRLPRRAWNLASQLRRAANSVHANIAEGNGRPTTVDYLRHLGISNASLHEVESNLYFIARRYSGIPGVHEAQQRVSCVAKPLAGLIKSLQRKAREA